MIKLSFFLLALHEKLYAFKFRLRMRFLEFWLFCQILIYPYFLDSDIQRAILVNVYHNLFLGAKAPTYILMIAGLEKATWLPEARNDIVWEVLNGGR